MGLCQEGPIVVAYPEGVWYRHVTAADVPEIVSSHLAGGKPVKRLSWDDSEARQLMTLAHDEKVRSAKEAREKSGTLPDALNEKIRAYQASRSVLTALELDVFSAVGEGGSGAEVANRIPADARALEMLLNALAAIGLLTKKDGVFHNTAAVARYFARGSKDDQREGLLHNVNIWHRWSTLTEVVRTGKPVPLAQDGSPEWTKNFIAGMEQHAKARAPEVVRAIGVKGVRRVLDLGGGSGIYSSAFAKASPDLRCVILDLPEVVPLTKGYIERAGVQSQVDVRAGDMLQDELGDGYDLVMLNAICHMFSPAQNQDLFRRALKALAPNGRLLVQDFILNPDKTGPPHAALFSLNMLVGTDGGATYGEDEYASWMRAAGFSGIERLPLTGPTDLIVGQAM
jgi:(2Fe-2S) ferredoxin/SAM-dependent methyltransferase